MTLLITRGTIVTATDQYRGDIFIEGEKIAAIGTSLTMTADRTIDATGKYRLSRRHRRAYASRYAVWGHHIRRRFRVRHGGSRPRWDHHNRRLRDSVQGSDAPSRVGHMDEEGRGQGRDRLRLPHDHHGAVGSGRAGDGRARPPGRDLVQALHGLSGRLHAGRCHHLPGAAADREERRNDLHARRERRRHRRAGEARAGRRARPRPNTTRSRDRLAQKARRRTGRLRSQKWPMCRSTSSISRRPRRSRW